MQVPTITTGIASEVALLSVAGRIMVPEDVHVLMDLEPGNMLGYIAKRNEVFRWN